MAYIINVYIFFYFYKLKSNSVTQNILYFRLLTVVFLFTIFTLYRDLFVGLSCPIATTLKYLL